MQFVFAQLLGEFAQLRFEQIEFRAGAFEYRLLRREFVLGNDIQFTQAGLQQSAQIALHILRQRILSEQTADLLRELFDRFAIDHIDTGCVKVEMCALVYSINLAERPSCCECGIGLAFAQPVAR